MRKQELLSEWRRRNAGCQPVVSQAARACIPRAATITEHCTLIALGKRVAARAAATPAGWQPALRRRAHK